jgi:hypothetical protein
MVLMSLAKKGLVALWQCSIELEVFAAAKMFCQMSVMAELADNMQ